MMRRLALTLSLVLTVLAAPFALNAQEFSGLARLDTANSVLKDTRSGLSIELYLSQPIPFRVFTLTEPNRLVIDFREVDWRGASRDVLLQAQNATDVRFGGLRPGWSRMVVDLAGPLSVETAGLAVSETDGTAKLTIELERVSEETYAAASGAPNDPDWELLRSDPTRAPAAPSSDDTLVVVLDPGHGGIDPGAKHGGVEEADLMLILAQEVAQTFNRMDGIEAVLTRSSDIFLPLSQRTTIARAAGADLMISLHADALEADQASGASVYTLSRKGQDEASARMAERHERGDLLAGLDLKGQDDRIATALMDLARLDTEPQSMDLADQIVQGLRDAGATVNSSPRRSAQLAVLNAADFPSVLVEVGFLSSASDRSTLSTAIGRAPIVAGIVAAVQRWQVDQEAKAPLLRQ